MPTIHFRGTATRDEVTAALVSPVKFGPLCVCCGEDAEGGKKTWSSRAEQGVARLIVPVCAECKSHIPSPQAKIGEYLYLMAAGITSAIVGYKLIPIESIFAYLMVAGALAVGASSSVLIAGILRKHRLLKEGHEPHLLHWFHRGSPRIRTRNSRLAASLAEHNDGSEQVMSGSERSRFPTAIATERPVTKPGGQPKA